MLLEIFSLMILPFASYLLLGVIHLVFMTMNTVYEENRYFSPSELSGSFFILISVMITVFMGGAEGEMLMDEFDEVFNVSYFVWMIGSMFANLSLRSMGYYAGKLFVETSIPAQIYIWYLAFLKIGFLSITAYITGYLSSYQLMYMCFTIALIAYCIATPFFNLLAESYNVAEVYSGYYIWLLSYGLPLAIGVVCPGTHYTT